MATYGDAVSSLSVTDGRVGVPWGTRSGSKCDGLCNEGGRNLSADWRRPATLIANLQASSLLRLSVAGKQVFREADNGKQSKAYYMWGDEYLRWDAA